MQLMIDRFQFFMSFVEDICTSTLLVWMFVFFLNFKFGFIIVFTISNFIKREIINVYNRPSFKPKKFQITRVCYHEIFLYLESTFSFTNFLAWNHCIIIEKLCDIIERTGFIHLWRKKKYCLVQYFFTQVSTYDILCILL